jgi:hypothetical protein
VGIVQVMRVRVEPQLFLREARDNPTSREFAIDEDIAFSTPVTDENLMTAGTLRVGAGACLESRRTPDRRLHLELELLQK